MKALLLMDVVHLTSILRDLRWSVDHARPEDVASDAGRYMRLAEKVLDVCTAQCDAFGYRMVANDLARHRAIFDLAEDYFPSESGATGLRAWQVKP